MRKKLIVFLMLAVALLCFSAFATGCSCAPEVEKYTISYATENSIKGGVSGTYSSGKSVKKGTEFELRASANTGYEFVGWYEEETLVSSANPYAFSVSKNVSYTAKFSIKSFALTYGVDNAERGSVSCSIQSGTTVDYNTAITITAQANTGYTFDKWYVAGTDQVVCETAEFTFNMPAQAYPIEARFTINAYVLTVDYDAQHCDVLITDGENTYQSGDTVVFGTPITVTVSTKTGYDFIKWVEGQTDKTIDLSYSFDMPASPYSLEAVTKKQIKTVKYISESVIIRTEQVEYGDYAPVYQPSRANYEFVGWYADAGKTILFNFAQEKITKDILLYAEWEEVAITYSVEFVDWNGKRIGSVQTVKEGLSAIIPANPEREGYDFDTWVCDGDYTNVQSNLIVVATYNVKVFTVNFYKDSAKTDLYDSQEVEYNGFAKTPATITDLENQLFDAWVYEDLSEFDFSTPIVSDLDLIATYVEKPEITYEVKFFANGELIDTQYVAENGFAKAPTVTAPVGEVFNGWDNDVSLAITKNTEFNAQFVAQTFSVTFVDFDQTEIAKQTIEYGQSAVAPANPARDGYEFIGWDCEFDNVTEDLVITAEYKALVYKARCYDGSEQIDEITAEYGKAFAVPTTPEKDGFSFAGWYVDATFSAKYDFTTIATEDVYIYAKFEEIVLETYTVTFYVDNEIISEQIVYSGKDAVAPGVPTLEGHTFKEWSAEFTCVTEDISVLAIFTKNSYTVIFYEEDMQTIIKTESVLYGESANPPQAPSVLGKEFVGWSEEYSEITQDTEIYALYESQTVSVYFLDEDGSNIASATVEYGGYVGIPKTPSKVGHIFKGWFTDEQLQNPFDFSTQINEDTTLYAGWEKIFDAFTVHFYVDGELYGNVQMVAEGKLVIEPGLPDGYTIWINRATGEAFDFDTPIDDNLILDALAE